MALKVIAATKMKLEKGAKIEGYLLSAEANNFEGDSGPVSLCKVALKVPSGDVVTLWLGDSTYAAMLVKGQMTRISKVETKVDGQTGTKTVVEQDEDDKISV